MVYGWHEFQEIAVQMLPVSTVRLVSRMYGILHSCTLWFSSLGNACPFVGATRFRRGWKKRVLRAEVDRLAS